MYILISVLLVHLSHVNSSENPCPNPSISITVPSLVPPLSPQISQNYKTVPFPLNYFVLKKKALHVSWFYVKHIEIRFLLKER